MLKIAASLLVLAIAANSQVIHAPVNRAYNIHAPYSLVDQDGLQNSMYSPFNGMNYPGNYQLPYLPHLPPNAFDNVRINMPITHQMNLMSPSAVINSNNMQNLATY